MNSICHLPAGLTDGEIKRRCVGYPKLVTENKQLRNEFVKEAARLISEYKQLQAELEKYRWIPVSKRLPLCENVGEGAVQSEWVRITDGKQVVDAYYYDYTKREAKPNYAIGRGWHCYGIRKSEITHWQPIILPEPTRKEKENPKDED